MRRQSKCLWNPRRPDEEQCGPMTHYHLSEVGPRFLMFCAKHAAWLKTLPNYDSSEHKVMEITEEILQILEVQRP